MISWQNAAGLVAGLLLAHFAIVLLKRRQRRLDAADIARFREWQQRQAAPARAAARATQTGRAWDDGYREACGHHGGYDSCVVRDHSQHRINPYRIPSDSGPCDHVATLTAPIHAAIGPWIHTTSPVTICVTCRMVVGESIEIVTFGTRETP